MGKRAFNKEMNDIWNAETFEEVENIVGKNNNKCLIGGILIGATIWELWGDDIKKGAKNIINKITGNNSDPIEAEAVVYDVDDDEIHDEEKEESSETTEDSEKEKDEEDDEHVKDPEDTEEKKDEEEA